MAIATSAQKNTLAAAYTGAVATARLYSTVPSGGNAGTAIAGASVAATGWSTPANGVTTKTVTFNVPAGATVAGAGVHDSGGNFLDGGAVTSQAFATAGTYDLTITFTVV